MTRLLAGVLIILACITGYVVLAFQEGQAENLRGLFLFGSIIATPLLVADKVDETLRRTRSATDMLEDIQDRQAHIERNTNGILTAKFEAVTEKAAEKAVEKVNGNGKEKDNG